MYVCLSHSTCLSACQWRKWVRQANRHSFSQSISVCFSVYLCLCLPAYLSVWLWDTQWVIKSDHPPGFWSSVFLCLSAYLFVYLSVGPYTSRCQTGIAEDTKAFQSSNVGHRRKQLHWRCQYLVVSNWGCVSLDGRELQNDAKVYSQVIQPQVASLTRSAAAAGAAAAIV